jgi:hypothetical protein
MKVMNGLRIFIRTDHGPIEDNVFYSQRRHGPVYRWHYEKPGARWHVTRVDTSHWNLHELATTRWQLVPQELQAKLSEHYIE